MIRYTIGTLTIIDSLWETQENFLTPVFST